MYELVCKYFNSKHNNQNLLFSFLNINIGFFYVYVFFSCIAFGKRLLLITLQGGAIITALYIV